MKKLSAQTGKEYRLLSESEWEYIARAGSTTKYPWGDEIDSSMAKYDYTGSEYGKVPVGSYSANAFGLHDTAGNVDEWVEDCWHENYQGAPIDGSAWTSGSNCSKRVLRGGSSNGVPWSLRSAVRDRSLASSPILYSGFRIARTLSQ